MFTLFDAREAIGSPAIFARGYVYAQHGCVKDVTVQEEDGVLTYHGAVYGLGWIHRADFTYDENWEEFESCGCTCGEFCRSHWGCPHVAALVIAVCDDMIEPDARPDGQRTIEALLEKSRRQPAARWNAMQEAPVHVYPYLRRLNGVQMRMGAKIGRTRAYVVRSMAELAMRAARRTTAVYGRELTFSHSEEELAAEDVALFGQIVMLAGDETRASGGELTLSGAALDQMMRLLRGREIDVRGENGETRRVRVVCGDVVLPLELACEGGEATLRVLAENVVTGQAGAYALGGETICCAFGEAFTRIAGLLELAAAHPQGAHFDGEQLDEVCARLILPAKTGAVMRKGQGLLAGHTPTPAVVRLYVDAQDEGRLTCRAAFDYCGVELASGKGQPHIRWDGALEEDVHAAVGRLFPEQVSADTYAFEGNDDARFALLSERLPALERVGEVHISRRLAQMHVKRPRTMTFGLTGEADRLRLHADLGGYTQEELAAALAAYREKRAYVRLSSGTFLSGEALEQAADAAQVLDGLDVTAEQAQAGVDVPMSRAMYLDAALKRRKRIALHAPDAIAAWTQRMERAQQTRVGQPAGLRTQLRGYQTEGLSWLCALSDADFGGILADDMGLGKTIQTLAMLLREREQGRDVRALVVCPASLQLNWLSEARRFAPDLTCVSLTGAVRARAAQIGAPEAPNILITSYDQLRRDVQAHAGAVYTHVLLDEAQNIKNAASQAAKAVKTLNARHRFAMTGTPIENRLSELWSIFDFLMPGYLGAYRRFRERFEAPVVRGGDERARENLHLLIAPFVLRRMKKDVLADLPEKVETVLGSEMTAEQRRLYAAYAARLRKESEAALGGGQERMKILAGLTRLRQLCCDPRLCLENYEGGSGKLAQLLEVVHDALAGGHRLLLFSQFTSMLALIGEALEREGVRFYRLTGETDKEARMTLVERFNAGDADVFLISLKAGGTGLNLTGADVVIHYDPWWNVAAQNQATDRAYRIGQTKGVQVIRLIALGTVEEQILKLQESKQKLGDGVLDGDENFFTMDAQTLREVLGG